MVVQLLGVETVVIVKDVVDSIRILHQDSQCTSYWSVFIAVHVIYPLKNILSHCSIFLVVIIAREQTNALRNPIGYKERMTQR